MIVKTVTLLMLLHLATPKWQASPLSVVSCLSVGSSGKSNLLSSQKEISNNINNNNNVNRNADIIQTSAGPPANSAPNVPQSTTLQPPLLTTMDNMIHHEYPPQQLHHQQHYNQHQASDNQNQQHGKQRSDFNGDHEDSIPLATINNHSRNSQLVQQATAISRPAQYVDVSALVGRNVSQTQMAGTFVNQSSGFGNAALGGLTAKSRSGLPECATQQVCNAIFVRMNYTQKLCECSSNYNWKCSNTLDPQDGHTIELTRKFDKRIYTQIKTCEPLREVRACKSPTDWTLLALQSERSGKAHYVVVCKCPTWAQLEGPYTHNHPPYANIPGK